MKLLKIISFLLLVTVFFGLNLNSQNIWTGSSDNYWNTSANWSLNRVPLSSDDVIIPDCTSLPNIPERSGTDMVCNNLTIKPGGQLTVYRKILHVYGNLIIESPDNSNASGSLIEAGEEGDKIIVDGTVSFQRFYSVNNRYQYVSSPIKNVSSSLFTNASTSGYFNPNFYSYNETYDCNPDPVSSSAIEKYEQWMNTDLVNAWEEYHNGEGNSGINLITGQGYVFYNDADVTINYSGNTENVLNNGNISVNVTNTANDGNSGYYDGWNLIGNPYPSAYDFATVREPGDVDSTIYLWNGTNYIYYNYNGNTEDYSVSSYVVNESGTYNAIPAGQAFFVKAKPGGGTFDFSQRKRIHSNQAMTKKTTKNIINFVKFRITDDDFSDETVIRFIENATEDYDGAYDAYKLPVSNENIPQIFTETLNTFEPLAINSLPAGYENNVFNIPLTVKVKQNGNFQISVIDDYLFECNAFLTDNYTGETFDLKKTKTINVNLNQGLNDNRFTVKMQYLASNIDITKNNINIYP
ncbi:MAG: hypothetical protein GXO50_00770, partial [Chlorobi bacterium]|nr:hypothetical protein [Chlorobiota bacterium]